MPAPLSTIWVPSSSAVCGGDPSSVVLSEPLEANLVVYRGDTGRFRVQVRMGADLLDLTAATWDADIRETADATTVIGSMTVTLIDPETVEVFLSAVLSANLPPVAVWDLQMNRGGDVDTLMRGIVETTKDISRGTGLAAFDVIVSPADPDAVIVLNDGVAEGFGTGTWSATVDGVTVPTIATTDAGTVTVTVDCTGVATGVHELVVTHSTGRTWSATLWMEAP